jgi:hypothetical protein
MGAREDLLAIPDAVLRDGTIAEAVLCWMDFATGAKRWWAGFGDLDHAGHIWQGTGDLISISDLTTDYQMSADPVTFSMAATADLVALVKTSKTAVRGRSVIVYAQLFMTQAQDAAVGPWQPLGAPMALFSGTMGPMTYAKEGPGNRQISLQCEGIWARRNAPPRGLLTDSDQQARHPGDEGLERVAMYTDYKPRWI